MTIEDWLGQENQLGMDIWTKKYCSEGEDFEAWIQRISGGNEEIGRYIKEKKFLFGGRILSNRGLNKQGRKVTYSNCYVIAPPEDEIESIFECAKKLARTYSYGGGCGVDISKLSPRGAKINNAAKETSGAVSFMELYSLVTALIGQNGRRGALMISIDCSHPDVAEFIELKTDLDKVTKANISIRIHEDFMEAVKKNEEYLLHYTRETTGEVIEKRVNARELFRRITETKLGLCRTRSAVLGPYYRLESFEQYKGVFLCGSQSLCRRTSPGRRKLSFGQCKPGAVCRESFYGRGIF